MRSFSRHLPHYFALFGVLIVGLLAFLFFSYDRLFQASVAVALAASYVSWGIVHHWLHHDLHLSVVIEYIAVACLGLVMVFSLIFRA